HILHHTSSPSLFTISPSTPSPTTLSLHDALPISSHDAADSHGARGFHGAADSHEARGFHGAADSHEARGSHDPDPVLGQQRPGRSEEHTSELQSRFDLVCRLLLEKKKK